MSDYCGVWRSNFFTVRDLDEFDAWIKKWPDADYKRHPTGKVILTQDDRSAWGGIPAHTWAEDPLAEDDLDDNPNFLRELAGLVEEGSVCVLRFVGFEKLTYIDGYTYAVLGGDGDPDTRILSLNLQDIERMAKKAFARPVDPF